ncbi:flagellar export chaperone FlgN [Shewanella carassii]|uniref:Flagellar protein FlgN n=1 Tax=Shewanella carassii TaxID=1987584 RepID=A0ABQ1TBA7_9GAMM|nr:flagellar export chaperone FlgN [Shewanella carassii]GGE89937.1 hypothetical protein GCM10011520_32980 [Shewanella carassii]
MSGKRQALNHLVAGIRQDILDYRELKALLQQQRQLMLRHDNQGLIQHNQLQDRLVAKLQQSSQQRSGYLTQIGVSNDHQGIKLLARKLPASAGSKLEQLWQQLLQQAKESQRLNELNGQLLVRQQEVIRGILGINNADEYQQSSSSPQFL